jgi:hypothetical protein
LETAAVTAGQGHSLGATGQERRLTQRCGARLHQVAVLAHSWGDNVWRTFMRWASVDDAGWVERHVAAYVNIAGTILGVSKSVTSLLSGARPPRARRVVRGPAEPTRSI